METPERLGYFISRVASDERLKPTHISLYVALCHAWMMNRFQQCYNVSRRQLMRLSRIQSKSTYHRAISELVDMGYINYRPSYHPKEGSEITLLVSQFPISKGKIMNKKIYFITQAKGGAGKSVLAFMLAEKYKEAVILDLDDATTTSIKQLAYRKPVRVSFLDPTTKRIDRGAFNGLFESVIEANRELFIADLGASVAEQLPKYFVMNGIDVIVEVLRASNIELQIVCVVGGGNIFKATMEHLDELIQSTNGHLNITVAHNGFYPCSDEQQATLVEYTHENDLVLMRFDLVKDKGEIAMRTVENVLRNGRGLAGLSPFTSIYFKKPIEELNL